MRQSIAASQRRIDYSARALSRELRAWLIRFARFEAERAIQNPTTYARNVRKEDEREGEDDTLVLTETLRRLLMLYGLRQIDEASKGSGGGRSVVPGSLMREPFKRRPQIKWFWELDNGTARRSERLVEETRNRARDSVRQILEDASKEEIRPGPAEIARRIRTAFTGPGDIERPHRVHATEEDRAFIFSSERAAIIARTELAMAENTGIMEGYKATGVKQVEWLARSDGRSGDRHHERMNGVVINVGDYFVLPSGARLRYPADPTAPIGETIQCRCVIVPARERR